MVLSELKVGDQVCIYTPQNYHRENITFEDCLTFGVITKIGRKYIYVDNRFVFDMEEIYFNSYLREIDTDTYCGKLLLYPNKEKALEFNDKETKLYKIKQYFDYMHCEMDIKDVNSIYEIIKKGENF